MWSWIYPIIGVDLTVDMVMANSSFYDWQTAPIESVVENSYGVIQAALDDRISRNFGSHTVGRFTPGDFAGISPQYLGTNRTEILADFFNNNADIIAQLADDLTIWEFIDDDDGGGSFSDDGWCW